MEATTRDRLFGAGRTREDLQGVFAPRSGGPAREKGGILSTFKGFGRDGKGRDAGLDLMERFGLISSEQRAAAGPVGAAADGAVESSRALGFTAPAAGPASATAGGAAIATPRWSNPVYGGLYAQTLMAQTGFIPPIEPPDGVAVASEAAHALPTDDVASTVVADTADQIADDAAALERRLVESFEQLAALPDYEHKVSALAQAVDATAASGHGGDAFDVLAQSLAQRPTSAAADSLEAAIASVKASLAAAPVVNDAVHAATPLADEVAKVVAPASEQLGTAVAPAADDAAQLVARAAFEAVETAVPKAIDAAIPRIVEAAVPKVVEAAAPLLRGGGGEARMLLGASDDVLRGVMPFAAGVDDTLRMLARVRA